MGVDEPNKNKLRDVGAVSTALNYPGYSKEKNQNSSPTPRPPRSLTRENRLRGKRSDTPLDLPASRDRWTWGPNGRSQGPSKSLPPIAPAVTFHILRALHQHILREVWNLASEGSQAAPDLTQGLAQAGAEAPKPGRHRCGLENNLLRSEKGGQRRRTTSPNVLEPLSPGDWPKSQHSGFDKTGVPRQRRLRRPPPTAGLWLETQRPGLGLYQGPNSSDMGTPAGPPLILTTSHSPG